MDSEDAPPNRIPRRDEYEEGKAKRHLRGWLSYAFASQVFVVVSLTLFLPICLEQFARDNGYLLPDKTRPCSTVKTAPLNAADTDEDTAVLLRLAGFGSTALASALTVISMGGIADHPPHQKRALFLFATLGSISAMLFLALPSSSSVWPLAALFAIIANVGFGASAVAMNPATVAREHRASPEAQTLFEKYTSIVSHTTARISGTSISLGYFAGIVALVITLVPVTLMKGSTFSLRLAIFASGLWRALFSIPAARDACQFAHYRRSIVNAAGVLGALVWPRIQRRVGWSNKRVLNTLVCACGFIPLYGCLGFLPPFRFPSTNVNANTLVTAPHFGGLTTPGEMYALAVYFGAVYGAFQAYARTFYAELGTRGEEARWYALYSITDKSSSFLGPLVVGLIANATGDIRYSFFFLVTMIWSTLPLLWNVDVERGREDVQKYSEREAGR
ncbi:ATG22_4 [Sanghuangporus weigelae]